mmetsp:Transcript_57833/g.135781  ORF Transcript_57833/g.135781 Transcript_57833/m.135781 type:complete len:208 (-) Transcript_57833:182-805(-)
MAWQASMSAHLRKHRMSLDVMSVPFSFGASSGRETKHVDEKKRLHTARKLVPSTYLWFFSLGPMSNSLRVSSSWIARSAMSPLSWARESEIRGCRASNRSTNRWTTLNEFPVRFCSSIMFCRDVYCPLHMSCISRSVSMIMLLLPNPNAFPSSSPSVLVEKPERTVPFVSERLASLRYRRCSFRPSNAVSTASDITLNSTPFLCLIV